MIRFFDILFSGFALLILSPILVPVSLILKLTGEGEIFYFQKRVGKDGKIFKLFKFATMLKNSENMGAGTVTVKNDPRVLPVGKFLRKTKINELPQLINIFIGDMSVIGPRPLTSKSFSAYSIQVQSIIRDHKPGLSGIGSIIFRNEEELLDGHKEPFEYYTKEIAPYKGELEKWFALNRSLSLYFLCIFLTVMVVMFPNRKIVSYFIKTLPRPQSELKHKLNF